MDKVRTLIWRRKSVGFTTSEHMEKRLKNPCMPKDPMLAYELKKLLQGSSVCVEGRRVLFTKNEFERLCHIYVIFQGTMRVVSY